MSGSISRRSMLPVAVWCEVCVVMTEVDETETPQEEEPSDDDCRYRQVYV
jgi:hypothetical protein